MIKQARLKIFFFIPLIFTLTACTQIEEKVEDIEQGQRAVAVLYAVGNDSVRGLATFTKTKDLEGIKIAIDIYGLKPGEHGLHLLRYGAFPSLDSGKAREIFDPLDKPHGGPDRRDHQLGDWGNIAADQQGHAVKDWVDIDLSFSGPFSIIGRSVVIHRDADDLISEPDGNSGPVVAYGTIGRAKPLESNK